MKTETTMKTALFTYRKDGSNKEKVRQQRILPELVPLSQPSEGIFESLLELSSPPPFYGTLAKCRITIRKRWVTLQVRF